ncbi:MAG: hypothetical protein KF875_09170 [Trueperaceae bacterium]|nr:hypothetical protein [Trueperaceae bacterium]MCC6312085.1 hypothetical protein [Trueperaceae bacterium]MCW5819391.1 hypothetical protein [Trueperaceae bacterium]
MPKYLFSVLHDSDGMATAEEMAAIDAFNEQLQADGHRLFACGLAAPATATVVDGRGREAVLTAGSFVASEEHVVGFWIIQAQGADVALRLATEASKCCNRRIELRALFD